MAQTDWEVVSETPASAAVNTGWEVVSETPAAQTRWTGTTLSPQKLQQLQASANAGDATAKDVLRAYNAASWEVVSETPVTQPPAPPQAAAPAPQPPAPPQAAAPAPTPAQPKRSEIAPGEEFKKGVIKAATSDLPSLWEQASVMKDVGAALTVKQRMDLFDKIDKGEITSIDQLRGLDMTTGQGRMYFSSPPEMREKLKNRLISELSNRKDFVQASLQTINEYKKNAEKYAPRVDKASNIGSVADFTNFVASNLGSGAVQLVPLMLAAVATGGVGLGAVGIGMGTSEAVGNRLQFLEKELAQLPQDQRADAVIKYLEKTGDTSLVVGITSGLLDRVLGPAAKLVKQLAAQTVKGQIRKEAVKAAVKEVPKTIAGEGVAEALQETAQIAGKVNVGERDKFATKQTLIDIADAAAAGAAGSLAGAGANVGAAALLSPSAKEATPDASTPAAAVPPPAPPPARRVEPKLTRKKLPVSKGAEPVLTPEAQAAPVPGRVEPNLEEVQPPVEGQAAPAAGRVEPKLTDEALTTTALVPTVDANFTALVEGFRKKGYMTDDAERLARVAFEEQADPQRVEQLRIDMVSAGENPQTAHNKAVEQAVQEALDAKQADQQGATNVTRPIADTTGIGNESAIQPTPDAATTEGLGAPKRDGMVSTEQDVGELAEGKGKPAPAIIPPPPPPPPRAKVERTQEETDAINALDQGTKFPAATEGALEEKENRFTTSIDGKPWTYFFPGAEVVQTRYTGAPAKVVAAEPPSKENSYFGSYTLEVDVSQHPDGEDDDGNRVATKTIVISDEELNQFNPPKEGTPSGTKTVETVKTETQEQKAPAAGVSKRGRPKAKLTEEEKAEKAEERKTARREYMKGERTLPKVLGKLDKANEDIKPEDVESEADVINQSREKQGDKRDAINDLLDLEAKHRGTELGKRIKEVLNDTSRISKKELDDITKGRKVKAQERASKSNAGNVEVEAPNEGFKKDTNASQALKRIIDTGTPFQVFLAKRLLPFVMNTKFVVVEESDPLPEQLERHKEAWGEDENRSRGVYIENRATGEKTIYVRGSSGGEYQGINPTVVLHEVLHAALQQKLSLAKLAFDRGFSGDAKLTRAYTDLVKVMQNAEAEYNRLESEGKLPEGIADLKTKSEVFSSPHEFISYGMTDPAFQKFLMGAEGMKEKGEFVGERLIQPLSSLYNKFVDTMRELLGIAPDKFNALSDLIAVTNKVISSKLTPAMQMVAKSERKLASEAAKGKDEVALEAKKASKKITAAQRKIQKSKDAQETIDGIDSLIGMRDPRVFLDILKAIWSGLNVKKLQALLPAIQTNVLVEWGKNLGITNMDRAERLMGDMDSMRSKMLGGAANVVEKWLEINSGIYGKYIKGKRNELVDLSAVMHYSTDKGIDPSSDTKDPVLNKMWNGLSDTAKEVFAEVRDFYKSNYDLYRTLLNERIANLNVPGDLNNPDTPKGQLMVEIKKMYEAGKKLAPYFPLMRYGDYWLRVGSGKKKEFYMFESVVDREFFMRKRVRQLNAEGDARTLDQMKGDEDIETGNDLTALRNKSIDNESAPLLKEIFELIGDSLENVEAEKLKDQIYQLYLQTMPEQSFRRQFIHRKGTAGFSGDALRNFITSSTNMASQLARLKYSQPLLLAIDSAKEGLKGNPEKDKLVMLVDELGKRVELDIAPLPIDDMARSAANFANKSAFLYFMTSVKTAVVQAASLPIMGLPVLLSRHSAPSVFLEMGKMMTVFNDVGVRDKDGKFSMPTLLNSRRVNLNPEEQRAGEAMIDRGISEVTMTYDLMDRRSTPSAKYSGAWRTATNMMGALFHHVERLNREVMFMTSFRLSRKEGMSFDDAVEQAVKDTHDSLGNFKESNRGRIMRGPLGRILLQFKSYPAFVTTYFTRNAYRMMAGMDSAAKKEAAIQFFGSLAMSGLVAGYVGIPGISAAMGAVQGIINQMRDEEDDDPLEERDLETYFRNVVIPRMFGEAQIGGYKISELLDAGVLDTLTGYNMSNSLSMNNMWFPDQKEQATEVATVQQYALSMAGPFASLLLNQIPSAVDSFKQGKTLQGIEKLLPAALRTPVTAYRYSQEGVRTGTGAVIKEPEEFTRAQLIAQGLGARTTGLASKQDALFKANALKAKVIQDKGELIKRLDREAELGSDEAVDDAIEKVLKFNYRNPANGINTDDLPKMLQKRLEQRLKSDRGFPIEEKFYPALADLLDVSTEKLEREAAKE